MKKNLILISIAVIVLVVIIGFIIVINLPGKNVQYRPTWWIFKAKADYSGNWIGVINYYENTDTYRSFMTIPLFEVCSEVTTSYEKEDETTGEIEKGPKQTTKTYCTNYVKQLSNGYVAMSYPNSEGMAQRIAIFSRSIIMKSISYPDIIEVPKDNEGITADMGDSVEMDRDSFYQFVIEEHPLTELYFCDVSQNDLMLISSELANNEIDKKCRKIEVGTFGKE